MKAASGDTDKGGESRLCPIVEGLSLEILCVLDRERRGEPMLEVGRPTEASRMEPAIFVVFNYRDPAFER